MVFILTELEKIAELLERRNKIDLEISRIIGRPSLSGHLGEYIASKIFRIKLETSAATKRIDGVFLNGLLKGKTVNIKLYGKQEGLLDIALDNLADYYLVLTGPKSQRTTSRGKSRPLIISNVYLFEMSELINKLKKRGVKIGTATSVAKPYWADAEIYPHRANKKLALTKDQIRLLKLFAPR